jgi:hypothetical protein
LSSTTGVAVNYSCEGEEFFGDWGCDDSGTSGGWDETYTDGTTSAVDFSWDCVGFADFVSPVASSDGDDGEFGGDDGSTDSGGYFFGAFNTESNVSVLVSNNNECLESGSLTCTGLFLDRHNFHDFIFENGGREKPVNNLGFFDRERMKVDFFDEFDLAILY